MSRLVSPVGLVLAFFLTGSLLYADITPVNYPIPLAEVGVVAGQITNIDPVNQMIQIRDAVGMVQTIHVDDHVQISRNGQVVRLVDLNLGDSISVAAR